jgi:Spy/CpxP family protein refolding chaperone
MKTKHFFTTVLFVLVLEMLLSAQPFMGKSMREHLMKKPSPTMIYMMLKAKQKDFNITDSQLEQIKNKAFALEERIIPIESKNKLHHLELKKMMMNKKKDYEKINSLLSKISTNRQTIFIEHLKTKDAIDDILTPQQREAIKEARKKWFEKRPRRPEGGMDMHRESFPPNGDSRHFQHFDFNNDME